MTARGGCSSAGRFNLSIIPTFEKRGLTLSTKHDIGPSSTPPLCSNLEDRGRVCPDDETKTISSLFRVFPRNPIWLESNESCSNAPVLSPESRSWSPRKGVPSETLLKRSGMQVPPHSKLLTRADIPHWSWSWLKVRCPEGLRRSLSLWSFKEGVIEILILVLFIQVEEFFV